MQIQNKYNITLKKTKSQPQSQLNPQSNPQPCPPQLK
jgi:hypothetical protein